MKKLLLATLVLGALSCSKTYTCQCTTTYEGSESQDENFVEGKKKDAEAACAKQSITYNVIYSKTCQLL